MTFTEALAALISHYGYDALPLSTGDGYRIVDERGLAGYLYWCNAEHGNGPHCRGLKYTLIGAPREHYADTYDLCEALRVMRSADKGARLEHPRGR